MQILLILSWLVSNLFYILLQLYWWQVKEYRFDRFLAHLQTLVGKRLFLSQVNLLKIIVLLASLFLGPLTILLLYLALSFKYLRDVYAGQFTFPVLTLRMIQTLGLTILSQLIILNFSGMTGTILIILDLISPVVVGLAVFATGMISYFYKKRLVKAAREKILQHQNLTVIGVTGSFGKTTTKEFIGQLLADKYPTQVTPEHVNTEVGIAQFILNQLNKESKILVVEMGAYKRGEIRDICRMVKPKVGILTTISNQHLALFGSRENIIKAKFELIDSLPEDGLAVLNQDDKTILSNSGKYRVKKLFFAVKSKADIFADHIKLSSQGLSFTLHLDGKSYPVTTPIIGEQNVGNILAAVLVANYLKVPFKEILLSVKKLQPVEATMQVLRSPNGATLIDDSYNINPEGVKQAVSSLSAYPNFTKIVILSPFLELGSETKKSYQEVVKLAKSKVDQIIGIGLDLLEYKSVLGEVKLFTDTKQAVSYLKEFDRPNSVILFEGRNSQKVLDQLK